QVGTPTELYEKPVDTFVAAFIGSPAINLLHDVPVSEGRARLAAGCALPLPRSADHAGDRRHSRRGLRGRRCGGRRRRRAGGDGRPGRAHGVGDPRLLRPRGALGVDHDRRPAPGGAARQAPAARRRRRPPAPPPPARGPGVRPRRRHDRLRRPSNRPRDVARRAPARPCAHGETEASIRTGSDPPGRAVGLSAKDCRVTSWSVGSVGSAPHGRQTRTSMSASPRPLRTALTAAATLAVVLGGTVAPAAAETGDDPAVDTSDDRAVAAAAVAPTPPPAPATITNPVSLPF